ncbi:unnamed protein product [Periconia digitata]|uniref:Uncharacterized protein n=1 Tax=Periconia digitata TaxID=1303443 RepID=A0A9W4UCH8_9PLEO|nr:unnamed protein product [Periconia digitata]
MVPHQPFRGSIAMGASKYAPPQRKKEHAAFLAASASAISASAISDAASTAGLDMSLTVRQEQPPAATETKLNPGLQVAMEQGMALKQEVDEHTAKLSKSTSTAAATRQILMALHDALKSEDPAAAAGKLQVVETLWFELEKLYTSIQEARSALPGFIEKQNHAASLIIGTVANSAFRGVHDELKVQHQKVDLQHNLLVEQERAFEDAKARLTSQLQEQSEAHRAEVSALKDSISRMALTNGCLRQDLDAKTKEVAVQDLEHRKNLAKEQKKAESLAAELKHTQEKYGNQSVEYGNAFASMNEHKKTAEDLRKQTGDLQDTTNDLRSQLAKVTSERGTLLEQLSRVKEAVATAEATLRKLEEEHKLLKGAFGAVKSENLELTTKLRGAQQKAELLNCTCANLKLDNDTLRTAAADVNKKQKAENGALQASNTELQKQLSELKMANDKLNGEVDALKASRDGFSRQLLEAKAAIKNADLRASMGPAETHQEIATLKEQLASATQLGIDAYSKFKSMEPTYRKADEYRLENEKLKAGGATTAATEVAFWKSKYNQVLAEKLEG